MTYVTVDVNIDDVLSEMSDADLLAECKERGLSVEIADPDTDLKEEMTKAYMLILRGRGEQANELLREIMLRTIGRIV
jgi:hypothetical protein